MSNKKLFIQLINYYSYNISPNNNHCINSIEQNKIANDFIIGLTIIFISFFNVIYRP
jgi:hypothetical protein